MTALQRPISALARGRAQVAAWVPELLLLLAFAALLLWRLADSPPWWDEGWTMSVARNLVERGLYGRLLLGQPAPPGLEGSPVLVGLTALSFRLLGIGIWQARLPVVLCSLGALLLIRSLAQRLYGRAAARWSLVALLILPIYPQLHSVVLGRQVLGEMPLLFFLLAGYRLLLAALCRSWARWRSAWWIVGAGAAWALGLQFKLQYTPFWVASLLVPGALAAAQRQWRQSAVIALSLAAGLLLRSALAAGLYSLLIDGRSPPLDPISGVIEAVALVTEAANRIYTLQMSVTVMLPALLGCVYAAWRVARSWRQPAGAARLTELALLSLVGVWWGWYALLSVGTPRYVFPAIVVSSLFQARLLHDMTAGSDLAATLRSAATLLRPPVLSRQKLGALASMAMLIIAGSITVLFMRFYYTSYLDTSLQRAAAWLNTQTPEGARIESYEPELFFLLKRPYHFPPDQLHVDLILITSHHRAIPITYDATVADPDYLVLGEFGRGNLLYDRAIASGAFRLVRREGLYDIYERVR